MHSRNPSQPSRTLRRIGLLAAMLVSIPAFGQTPPPLSIRRTGPVLELSWPAMQPQPDGTVRRPYYELQRSDALGLWEPVGERQRGSPDNDGIPLGATQPAEGRAGFFRLLTLEPPVASGLAAGGAEVFGYVAAFTEELQRVGQLSADDFAAKFPNPAAYLPKLSWDPTTAQFWSEFNADIDAINATKADDDPSRREVDFRLTPDERAVFMTNGFVVSERLGSGTFADLFYRIWKDDLPVFISTDALLQAWHRTYDMMLQEVEETYLFNAVQTLLDGMASQVAEADAAVGEGELKDSLRDADWYLAVARSLLAGPSRPPAASVLGQNARVAAALADIREEQLKEVSDFMGFCRIVDFSQFKVRGHYTRSERLGRYFQCVMWLGRIDVPVAGGPFRRCPGGERMASPRELGLAVVFWHLLNQSGKFSTWAGMERAISAFVGWTDSLNFGQLNGVLAGAGIRTLADVPDRATLERLQAELVRGEIGAQNIRSDWFQPTLSGPMRSVLPQTFTVFGQKFVPDSWAFSQTVYSSILWVADGETNRVTRRVPGALDVAFATLGNDQVVPELVAQMKGTFADPGRPHALAWRDGWPYQHNLAATRAVMDRQTVESWSGNLYLGWLDTLRQLSTPTTSTEFPEAMRTRAWALKSLNTQLASWTQLRHDTILYAKQSYTDGNGCLYPKGYVEPRVAFWRRFKAMVERAAQVLGGLIYEGEFTYLTGRLPTVDPVSGEIADPGEPITNVVAMATVQARQVDHLRRFAEVLGTLQGMAEKELAGTCFTAEEEQFIRDLIQILKERGVCGGLRTYTGWYPRLYYRAVFMDDDDDFHRRYGAELIDTLVADVHTDVPSERPPDPGSVLHQAVGEVNLLLMAVDHGGDRFVCAGPVLSHYEFEVIGDPRRVSDEEWSAILRKQFPEDAEERRFEGLTPPAWTRGFLVPKVVD